MCDFSRNSSLIVAPPWRYEAYHLNIPSPMVEGKNFEGPWCRSLQSLSWQAPLAYGANLPFDMHFIISEPSVPPPCFVPRWPRSCQREQPASLATVAPWTRTTKPKMAHDVRHIFCNASETVEPYPQFFPSSMPSPLSIFILWRGVPQTALYVAATHRH